MASVERGSVTPGDKILSGRLPLTPLGPGASSPPATGLDADGLGPSSFQIYLRPYRARAEEIMLSSSYQTAGRARKGKGGGQEEAGVSPLCKTFKIIAWMLFALLLVMLFFLLFGIFGCGLEAPTHIVRFRNTTVATPVGGVLESHLLESAKLFHETGDINPPAAQDPSYCEDWAPPVNFPMSAVFNYTSVENLGRTTSFSTLEFTSARDGQVADGGAAIVVTITNPSRKRITTEYAWFNYNFWQAKFNYVNTSSESRASLCTEGNGDSVLPATEEDSNMPVWFLNLDQAARGRIALPVEEEGESMQAAREPGGSTALEHGESQEPEEPEEGIESASAAVEGAAIRLDSGSYSSSFGSRPPGFSGTPIHQSPSTVASAASLSSLASTARAVARDVLSSLSLRLNDSKAAEKRKLCKYCAADYGLTIALNPWFCVSPFIVRDARVRLVSLKDVSFDGLLIPDFNLEAVQDNVTFLLHGTSLESLKLTKVPDHTRFLFATENLTRATSKPSRVTVEMEYPTGCDPAAPVGVESETACQLRFWGVGGKSQSTDVKDNYYQLSYVTGVSLGSPHKDSSGSAGSSDSGDSATEVRFYFNGTVEALQDKFTATCDDECTGSDCSATVRVSQGQISLGEVVFKLDGLVPTCMNEVDEDYGSMYLSVRRQA